MQEDDSTLTLYIMNCGAGRMPMAMFDSEMDVKVYKIGTLMKEAWDKCKDSGNCSSLGGRSVVLPVACFRYEQ
jgi:hypothetical protein